jgi:iron(III) transport system permease protein
MSSRLVSKLLLAALLVLLSLPVLAVLASWLELDRQGWALLAGMGSTVLPGYALSSLVLCLAVAVGVTVLGAGSACAVALFDFPGRRVFEWALLLPLAMPAYVVAFAYTDFLQFSGPLQSALRESLGLQGRLLPDVQSLWGAVLVFTVCLYPYVYLLVRTALAERAVHLMEAARLLGAPLRRRLFEVALPLARPAIAAGVSLALMETLADFGASSYLGIQTFTAGIYKAWLAMDNRAVAAQLATVLLVWVAALLAMERAAERRLRFADSRGWTRAGAVESQPVRLHGRTAVLVWLGCAFPITLGFVLPVVFMVRPLILGWGQWHWSSFMAWSFNSLWLAGLTAVLATGLAVVLAYAARRQEQGLQRWASELVGLGYAIPGAVIVVGLLLALAWLQGLWPQWPLAGVLTTTAAGLIWAYLVRFSAVALQSVGSGYARIPTSLDDSARMLGVSGSALLWRVHVPLLRRAIAAAGLLVFVDVMKELPATLVLRPFDSDTLAVVAYQLARDERLGEAALPALALVAVGLLPVMLISRTLRAREDCQR